MMVISSVVCDHFLGHEWLLVHYNTNRYSPRLSDYAQHCIVCGIFDVGSVVTSTHDRRYGKTVVGGKVKL